MKKLNMKRIMSGALAGALALSMTATALAADGGDTGDDDDATDTPAVTVDVENRETIITGTYQDIALAVVVPASGNAFINPYGLPVVLEASEDGEEVKATDTNAAWTVSGQQIVSLPQTVTNLSVVDLNASVNVIGAVNEGSDMKLSATTTQGLEIPLTTKSAYVVFQMAETTLTGSSTDNAIATAAATASTWDSSEDVVVGTKAVTAENLVTLTKADNSGEAQSGSIALFRLTGDCVEDPKVAWADTDGFTTTITFTFKPAVDNSGSNG